MTKLFESLPILLSLIQLQVILLSGETQSNFFTDQVHPSEKRFREHPAKETPINQVQNEELKISNGDIPMIPQNVSSKDNAISSDPNPQGQCIKPSKPISRHARSLVKPAPKSQFEQICGAYGGQPCTCYYPDHPDVPIFELSSDEITLSKVNGNAPSNCSDLQAIGYSLKGFYMVHFNNKRIKTIYCEFNQINEKVFTEGISMPSTNKSDSSVRSEFSKFCNGLQSQPCKILYSDYPDLQLFVINKNISSMKISLKNYIRGPTNCGDLNAIGYYLNGFYWVSLNAKKVKLIYCDFNDIKRKDNINVGHIKLDSQNNNSVTKNTSSKVLPHCHAIGSQPCSCFYSNLSNTLQFELSNDELTRQAMSLNGTGPDSCDALKNIGYTLDGFYMVRFKTNILKSIYCIFNYTEKDEYNPETTTQSTLKPFSTPYILKNVQYHATNGCEIISRIRNSNKLGGKCIAWTSLCPLSDASTDFSHEACLNIDDCDNSSESQQWVFWNKSYICNLQGDVCFAAESTETIKGVHRVVNYRFIVISYNEAVSFGQQWAIDNGERIVYSSSGMCLISYYITSYLYGTPQKKSSAKLKKCSNKKGEEEWILEPILNTGVHKCANYSSLKQNDGENTEISEFSEATTIENLDLNEGSSTSLSTEPVENFASLNPRPLFNMMSYSEWKQFGGNKSSLKSLNFK